MDNRQLTQNLHHYQEEISYLVKLWWETKDDFEEAKQVWHDSAAKRFYGHIISDLCSNTESLLIDQEQQVANLKHALKSSIDTSLQHQSLTKLFVMFSEYSLAEKKLLSASENKDLLAQQALREASISMNGAVKRSKTIMGSL